jgi:hypothetical protein
MHAEFWHGDLKGTDHLEAVDVFGRIVSKWISKKECKWCRLDSFRTSELS